MRETLFRPIVRAVLLFSSILLLTGCNQDLSNRMGLQNMGETLGISHQESDPSVTKISADASIPILLSSNKAETTFTVNGTSLSPAKTLKVLVPQSRLVITAQAPCYRTLTQTAEADGFGRASLFQFSFGNWDRAPGARGGNCA